MDKILEKLASLGIATEDINEIKGSFDSTVDAKVKEKLDEEAKVLAKKADEFCQKKVQELSEKHAAEVDEMANKYCAEIKKQLEDEANAKVAAYSKSIEEAAEQYIQESYKEKFRELYGQELQNIEEKVITGVDKYLEYNIKEKIGPALIQKTALSEMYAPIIDGVKSLFEEQYIPLDTTGSKKIREMKAENAQLQKSLKKQLSENLRLAEVAETNSKKALIAEKTEGMSNVQKSKVKNFFESKSFSETKTDIDNYIEMLDEQTEQIRAMRQDRENLYERTAKPVRKSKFVEDKTDNMITETYRKRPVSRNEEDLIRSSKYC